MGPDSEEVRKKIHHRDTETQRRKRRSRKSEAMKFPSSFSSLLSPPCLCGESSFLASPLPPLRLYVSL
jgi:hypothetical protein